MEESSLRKCLVFDIETTTLTKNYTELEGKGPELWEKRCHLRYPEFYNSLPEQFLKQMGPFYQNVWEKKATFVPEYSKIICISVGTLNKTGEFKTISYTGDEIDIIQNFFNLISTLFEAKNSHKYLVGHNIKGFDISYLSKRALINGLKYEDFPSVIQNRDKKPWELNNVLDTKELFNFGANMHVSTLDEVCYSLGVKSPKDEIDGSQVYAEYYKGNIDIISTYCEEDVKSTWEVFKKLL